MPKMPGSRPTNHMRWSLLTTLLAWQCRLGGVPPPSFSQVCSLFCPILKPEDAPSLLCLPFMEGWGYCHTMSSLSSPERQQMKLPTKSWTRYLNDSWDPGDRWGRSIFDLACKVREEVGKSARVTARRNGRWWKEIQGWTLQCSQTQMTINNTLVPNVIVWQLVDFDQPLWPHVHLLL